MQFHHQVAKLLKENDGVFFGERHDHPGLRQAITILLPMFKANGAGTVSIELPQATIDLMRQSKNYDEFSAKHASHTCFYPGVAQDIFALVKKAQGLGLETLGHDLPLPAHLAAQDAMLDKFLRMGFKERDALAPEERARIDAALKARGDFYNYLRSEAGMHERDEYAAAYIKKHKVGKVLVLGGAAHSGQYGHGEALRWNHRRGGWEADPRGIGVNAYRGLDARLGIPSIDHDTQAKEGMIGEVKDGDRRFNTYETILPQYLGSLSTTQWPPRKGRPDIKDILSGRWWE